MYERWIILSTAEMLNWKIHVSMHVTLTLEVREESGWIKMFILIGFFSVLLI